MSNLTITLPDDKDTRIIKGAADFMGYQTDIRLADGTTIPNPETRKQFLTGKMKEFVKEAWRAGEYEAARKAAVQAITDIDTTVIT